MLTMYENVKIGIIGGDMRQVALGRRLSALGFETAVWGLSCDADIGSAVRAADWQGAVDMSSVVILPLPVSVNGVYINAAAEFRLNIFNLLNTVAADAIVIGGKFDNRIKAFAQENDILLYDCLECEELQIKNAVPTAEGALGIAIREMPITVADSNALVCGYGRIGKILSALLKNAGANVTVSARRGDDLAFAVASGKRAVRYGGEEFVEAAESADVIFNTVPAEIIGKKLIGRLDKCCLIVDLASGNGGVDFDAAEKHGIKTFHALALPGKVAPVTAGNAICDCILDILLKEGVITKS